MFEDQAATKGVLVVEGRRSVSGCGQRGLDVRSRFSTVHTCTVMEH
jgi:hypothetical protein